VVFRGGRRVRVVCDIRFAVTVRSAGFAILVGVFRRTGIAALAATLGGVVIALLVVVFAGCHAVVFGVDVGGAGLAFFDVVCSSAGIGTLVMTFRRARRRVVFFLALLRGGGVITSDVMFPVLLATVGVIAIISANAHREAIERRVGGSTAGSRRKMALVSVESGGERSDYLNEIECCSQCARRRRAERVEAVCRAEEALKVGLGGRT